MIKLLNKIFRDVCRSDADNTCKLPFFYNGVWFENCTLAPKDDYWCPTGRYSWTNYTNFSKQAQYIENFLLI